MPHIKPGFAKEIDYAIADLGYRIGDDAGALNYALCTLALQSINPQKYSEYADVIKALECAKLEIYRVVVAPYEDQKIEENGNALARWLPDLDDTAQVVDNWRQARAKVQPGPIGEDEQEYNFRRAKFRQSI